MAVIALLDRSEIV